MILCSVYMILESEYTYIYICIYIYRAMDLMSGVFANGPGDLGSIPGCHTKDSKNGT